MPIARASGTQPPCWSFTTLALRNERSIRRNAPTSAPTCSLDHPAALGAYRRAGFVAVDRKVETFIDPRLADILPRDCAPQVPLVERSGS